MKKLDGINLSVLCNACLAYFTDLLRVFAKHAAYFVGRMVLNREP